MPKLLKHSPHLFSVPPVDPERSILLEESSYQTWAAMFQEHPDELDYLLRPGNYRTWGTLAIKDRPGLTKSRPRTVRYHDPDGGDELNPVQREPQAAVDSFQFIGDTTTNWLVQGLTLTNPTVDPGVFPGVSNITVDLCLIEQAGQYSLRIRGATGCTVQRCVIRESTNLGEGPEHESSGIQVGPVEFDVLGLRILDNEIYDVGDGIQLTFAPVPFTHLAVEALIEGNDIYLTPSRYLGETNTTWAENAIDVKVGSDAPCSTIIRDNRMWGLRRNAAPTAAGEIITLHDYCRNLVIEDNVLGDAPHGISDFNWTIGRGIDVDKPRDCVVRNNQFYDIRDHAAADRSAATRPVTAGTSFVGNYFARSDYLADRTPPSGYRGDGPHCTGNVLVEIGAVQRDEVPPALVLRPEDGNTVATPPPEYDTYQRRRWTGPEFEIGAVPLY